MWINDKDWYIKKRTGLKILINEHTYFFSSGGNVTDEKCDEILASPDVNNEDDNAIINCKLSQEILPRLLDGVKTCREEFPPFGRLVYSCSSMVIQYLLPTITISVAYYQIYGQLKVI